MTVVDIEDDKQEGGNLASAMQAALKEGERRIVIKQGVAEILEPATLNAKKGGQPNKLRTTKFTPITWLPLSLMNQFKRLANVYFGCVAVIVCFGTWVAPFSPKDWKSKLGPFCFVLMWTALKDLYEDLRRKKDDNQENGQVAKKVNVTAGTIEDVFWRDVLAGDVIFVPNDAPFPADLILLKSAANETMFMSTVMLDGETNLKDRAMPPNMRILAESVTDANLLAQADRPQTQQEAFAFMAKMKAGIQVKMAEPSAALSDVRGLVLDETAKSVMPVIEENFLPKGCILRNTPFIIGVAAYVGDDTKTRLNATQAVLKFSNMQVALNVCIQCLLIVIGVVTVYATILNEITRSSRKGMVVPQGVKKYRDWPIYVMFFRFIIAFYHGVPMSLYVVYEMLKLVMGLQVNKDENMVADGENAKARTADLMEEMGQVEFIFSDKTGTLTANEMVYARGLIDGKDLGDFRKLESGGDPEGIKAVQKIFANKDQKSSAATQAVSWYFTCLAVCHEVVSEFKAGGAAAKPTYTGMSPDEVALVEGAREAGLVFMQRQRLPGGITEVEVRDPWGGLLKFEVPIVFQFNSDRKRMSTIVKSGGKAWCITKGADSVMEPLIAGGFKDDAKRAILDHCRTGLRVLVVGSRELTPDFLESWLAEYQKARGTLDDTKERKIGEVVAKMEKDLKFVGLTAVEDRLQDGVPEAIATLKLAGSRVWVLTGDKTETAVNIAYSCQLFVDSTKLAYVTGCTNAAEAREAFSKAKKAVTGARDAGIVIDGGTLLSALSDKECRELIFSLGMASQACICTRLSPMQKLLLVQLVREADPRIITLTIGDGANDVPMILGGHVGVGIRGKEGAAAVQVCDVAISRFRFLVPLLLCHGRRSYRRVAVFLCYYLYKNFVLLMADLVWMHFDKFRGNIAFPEYLSIGYNAFFTSWHILFVLGFDRDVSDEKSCKHPELYKVGPRRELFNARIFFTWMCYSVWHGLLCWIIPMLTVGTNVYGTETFWIASTAAFTNVIHVTLLKLVIVSEIPFHWITWLPTLGAYCMFMLYLMTLSYTPGGHAFQPQMRSVAGKIISKSDVFVTLIYTPIIAMFPDLVERLVRFFFFPSDLQRLERGLPLNTPLNTGTPGKEASTQQSTTMEKE